jgi:hypothetical protein
MSVSRRALLASASTILLPLGAKPAPLLAAEPTASGDRINLGLNGTGNNLLVYPFINIWKCAGHIQVIAGGISYWSSIPPGDPGSAWNGYIDSDGELMRPLASEATHMLRVFYGPQRDGIPAGYNRVGEQWLLKWDGIASDISIAGALSLKRSGNRISWTWGSNTAEMSVTFAGMDRHDPPRNIRLCEERYEARLDGGEIFDPEWLAIVREGSGIIRFMCWQNPCYDLTTLRFSDIPDERYCSYGGLNTSPFFGRPMKPLIKGGVPLSLMSGLANRAQSHPWVCIPNVLGTTKLSSIATVSNANPAIVTSPGHTWEDGDQVIPFGANWPQIEKRRWTVVNSDQKAGRFALRGVDSTSFGPFESELSLATAPYDLDSIVRELVPFAAHFRDNVAPGLITYFELGNENWNDIFVANHWLSAQARIKFGKDDSVRMAGYLAAHCMKVIRDTYGAEGRNQWRGVLATHSGVTDITFRLIDGVKQYISEHDRSLNITDLFDDLAVVGYFGRYFNDAQKATVMGWIDVSEQRWKDGLEPTKYSFFNRVINEGPAVTVETYAIPFWRAQKNIADGNGLGFIQYEGGNGNVAGFFGNLSQSEQARFMDFYRHACHTAEDARNYTSMFNAFIAMGGKYPAKFVEAGDVNRYGNWGALRYPGDSNPVWDAVVAFNGRI